jgi:hypothetical protein
VTDGGQPRRVEVPIDMPEGVSREGVSLTANGMRGRSTNFIIDGVDNNTAGGTYSAEFGRNSGAAVEVTAEASTIQTTQSQVSAVVSADRRQSNSLVIRPHKPSKREVLARKLHPELAALVARLEKKGSKPASEEAKFVTDGKALVQIFLADRSEKTMAELRKLGVEIVIESKASNTIIARIPVEKLKSLALLKYVNYLAPQALLN